MNRCKTSCPCKCQPLVLSLLCALSNRLQGHSMPGAVKGEMVSLLVYAGDTTATKRSQ